MSQISHPDYSVPLILASSSPRRQQFLQLLGIPFLCRPAQIPEVIQKNELPEAFVKRLAETKARKVLEAVSPQDPPWILAADTVVTLPPQDILGKPMNREEAHRFLQKLSGKTHEVLTAFCLWKNSKPPASGPDHLEMVKSEVTFRNLSDPEITAYLDTREWQDKAGGYGIQNHGAFLITSVSGSFTNVVGLPLEELLLALKKLKIISAT